MVETLRPLFISFASKVTKEGENGESLGTLEVFTQIQDCPVTDEELLEIKRIQEQAAEKIDALFRKNNAQAKAKEDYRLDLIEEEELEAVPEAERKLIRYFIEHNPEKKVIEIRPGNGNAITLYGAQDVENFIEAIRDYKTVEELRTKAEPHTEKQVMVYKDGRPHIETREEYGAGTAVAG